jgi:hypothetical protein
MQAGSFVVLPKWWAQWILAKAWIFGSRTNGPVSFL